MPKHDPLHCNCPDCLDEYQRLAALYEDEEQDEFDREADRGERLWEIKEDR